MGDDDDDEVILLNFWISGFGNRVKIALAEKDVKYECRDEDFPNKSQLLLESNPVHKKVPVLIHNGKPICESLVILQYIDEVWNKDKTPLLPSLPYHKSRSHFWAHFIDHEFFYSAARTWKLKGEEQESGKKDLIHCLELLEKELGNKAYFGGESFGYVDIVLISYSNWFYTYETFGNFCIEAVCPKLSDWNKRCLERECRKVPRRPSQGLSTCVVGFEQVWTYYGHALLNQINMFLQNKRDT